MPQWLVTLLGGGLGDMFQKIVGTFKADPNKVLEMQQMIAQNQSALQQAELDLVKKAADVEIQLNATAGSNIQAEAKSGDKFVVRARPSVVWMGNILLLWNYAVVPFAGMHWHLSPVNLPEAFWWTWGTVVTGYVFARTGQELGSRLLGGQGGSAQLPFGIKMESKGD